MGHSEFDPGVKRRRPWNAGRKLGAKRGLKPQHVWAVRFWLDHRGRLRDRAMFDLAVDSKLRGCDVVKVKIGAARSLRAQTGRSRAKRPLANAVVRSIRNVTVSATWRESRRGTER